MLSGKGGCLNKSHRSEDCKLSVPTLSTIRSLAQECQVNEAAMLKIWENWEAIQNCYVLLFEDQTFQASVGSFTSGRCVISLD